MKDMMHSTPLPPLTSSVTYSRTHVHFQTCLRTSPKRKLLIHRKHLPGARCRFFHTAIMGSGKLFENRIPGYTIRSHIGSHCLSWLLLAVQDRYNLAYALQLKESPLAASPLISATPAQNSLACLLGQNRIALDASKLPLIRSGKLSFRQQLVPCNVILTLTGSS